MVKDLKEISNDDELKCLKIYEENYLNINIK